jgi:hypothetical protein
MDALSPIGPRLPETARVAPVEAVRIREEHRDRQREGRGRRRPPSPGANGRVQGGEDVPSVDVRA